MTRYLLDTNVLLHVVNKANGHGLIEQRIATTQPDQIRISALTVWEISRMVEKSKVPSKASKAAMAALTLFEVEPLTNISAAVGGNLHAFLANRGLTIGERDSMIAGVALVNDLVMVTDNVREFQRVPGLSVENWRNPK
jgi:tRNA(fMet)-specific endonuclease VapC